MTGEERRRGIVETLRAARGPLSGAALGHACGVSRQVVVQDIALIRRSGTPVVSTSRGYVLLPGNARPTRVFKCHHSVEESLEELDMIVDLGGSVEDVFVNHRAYGIISSRLDVRSRRDAARFMEEIRSGVSRPLMGLTDCYHFHHVSADSQGVLDEVGLALSERGFLAELLPYERGLVEESTDGA